MSPINRRHFLQTSASFTAVALTAHAHSHHHVDEAEAEPAPAGGAGPLEKVVSGSGDFRYEFTPDKLVLPPEVKMRNGHGLCLDAEGNIYFTFEAEKVEDQTRCLVRFKPDGTEATLLGANNALAHGTPHGLNIHVDQDGKPVLSTPTTTPRSTKPPSTAIFSGPRNGPSRWATTSLPMRSPHPRATGC